MKYLTTLNTPPESVRIVIRGVGFDSKKIVKCNHTTLMLFLECLATLGEYGLSYIPYKG